MELADLTASEIGRKNETHTTAHITVSVTVGGLGGWGEGMDHLQQRAGDQSRSKGGSPGHWKGLKTSIRKSCGRGHDREMPLKN